jgi:hypothetical protein
MKVCCGLASNPRGRRRGEVAVSTEKRDKVPSNAEAGRNVTPGHQTERRVYEAAPGEATRSGATGDTDTDAFEDEQ